MFDIELNTQFCPKNVGRTRVLPILLGQKMFDIELSTQFHAFYQRFLGQKMFDTELNTQFCSKNVGRTRVSIFEKMARKIMRAICSKIKT